MPINGMEYAIDFQKYSQVRKLSPEYIMDLVYTHSAPEKVAAISVTKNKIPCFR
jgi:hypothetical protein